MPNALLVYPAHPPTHWGAQYTLGMTGLSSNCPPLGLLTVAAMFPPEYGLRVVDMNVSALEDADLEWADFVFISAMITQRGTLPTVVERCNTAGVPVVAGGPYPTSYHEEIAGVDHFVLGEAENMFSGFLQDLENGRAKSIYREIGKPDMTRTPVPRFDLIDPKRYWMMNVQFSRGCPFDCEFCDITKLYGRVTRTKAPEQVIEEFEVLHRLGWRGVVFLVDDNFIGNKREAMRLLPAIARWQKARGYPFDLLTEATVNLARMDDLLDAMIDAGFSSVFLGIETPNPAALIKTKKPQNVNRRQENYLFDAIRTIQGKGMEVFAGFILGLDEDDESIFDTQIEFIQKAGIPMAVVGLLEALKDTNLYFRLQREGRLLDVDVAEVLMSVNFRPQMDLETLFEGFRRVVTTIFDRALENYFRCCMTMIKNVKPVPHLRKRRSHKLLGAEVAAVHGLLEPAQIPAFKKFVAYVHRQHPQMLPRALTLAMMGYHYQRYYRQQFAIHDFKEYLSSELVRFRETVSDEEAKGDRGRTLLAEAETRCRALPADFRYSTDGVDKALESFRIAVNDEVHAPQHLAAV